MPATRVADLGHFARHVAVQVAPAAITGEEQGYGAVLLILLGLFPSVAGGIQAVPEPVLGGAQAHYGVTPDLSTFGKIIGGLSMPVVEVPAGQQNSTVTLFLSGDGGWRGPGP